MPVVFVHGVPETPLVWARLIERLVRTDVVALQLPGFGSPLPADPSTMDFYAEWLADALGDYEVVDLVATTGAGSSHCASCPIVRPTFGRGSSTALLRYADGISVVVNVNSNESDGDDIEAVANAVHDLAAAAN